MRPLMVPVDARQGRSGRFCRDVRHDRCVRSGRDAEKMVLYCPVDRPVLARSKRRPDWWDWELLFGLHISKRMLEVAASQSWTSALCRKGTLAEPRYRRALAAYYYLPRRDACQERPHATGAARLVIDFAKDDSRIGIEITAPSQITVSAFNRVLRQLGLPLVSQEDLAPLSAA